MRQRLAIAISIVSLVAACGGSTGPTPSTPSSITSAVATAAAPTAAPTAAATTPPTRFDDRVQLADGGWLAAKCIGTGSPTILLEAGGTEGNMQSWGTQFPLLLAATTTVCRYSRRDGEGSSEAPDPLTWASMLDDAKALLATVKKEAGIGGPYVFVGWSFGGEVATGEAIAFRGETKGLVILDTDFPRDFMQGCLAAGRSKADCQAAFDEDKVALTIERDLIKTFVPLPEIPLLLVSAIRPGPDCSIEPGASAVTYELGPHMLTAPDCAGLFQKIADAGAEDWKAMGTVQQTRVDADHDGLIKGAGRQIAGLILDLIAGT
jgi:pimeloyl-ACP methyl ester carboxylesterase